MKIKTFTNKSVMNDIITKEEYKGSVDEKGLPHGKGINTTFWDDKVRCVEEGVWQRGFLVEGSETIFSHDRNNERDYPIKKEIGKWRYDEKRNYCEEFLSGEGEELHFKNEEDFKRNKPSGYIKGIFDDGTLLKGEVFNAYKIGYSEHSFVKRIIINGKSKKNVNPLGYSTRIDIGVIFFENGDRYEGEIDYDCPQGNGTMYYEDGTSLKGEWSKGNYLK